MSSFAASPVRVLATLVTSVIVVTGGWLYWQTAQGHAGRSGESVYFLRGEGPVDLAVVERLMFEMASLETELERQLQIFPTGKKRRVEVSMFATRQSYTEFVSQKFPELTDRNALFLDEGNAGRVVLYCHEGTLEDLRHECTHAFLHSRLRSIPLWLDEGLAEYFEIPAAERIAGNRYLTELARLIDDGWEPDLERLEKIQRMVEFTGDNYRESWAWTHFLFHGPENAQKLFRESLIESQSGAPACRLSEQLKHQFPDLKTELVTHLKNFQLRPSP